MTRHREFTTAAARRRANPIVWMIDGTEVRPRWDLVIADLEPLMQLADGLHFDGMAGAELAQALTATVDSLVAALDGLIIDEFRADWQQVAPLLDLQDLMAIAFELIGEVTGKNPTLPSDSSISSATPGLTSTDGAEGEASILAPSPSTDS